MNIMIACRAIDNMAGGVERQSIALINEMIARGHRVSLITLDHDKAQSFYPISEKATWHKMNTGNPKVKAGLKTRLERAKKLRAIVAAEKPDVILAFQQGMFLSTRLYTIGMNVPVIAAERESPFRYDFTSEGRYKGLIFQTFRFSNHVTVQCESYINAYPKYLRGKITTIPNPVFPATIFANPAGEKGAQKTLLCVARLGFAKNQTCLIEAFVKIAANHPDWKLLLAGEGEDRAKLQSLINDLGMQNKIEMPGAIKDVASLYASSHLFCLPSRWEGFPNALAEALAHGLPAIGFDGCGGVRDLIEHEQTGLLAQGNGNTQSLADCLSALMNNADTRQTMGKRAIQSMAQYAPEIIYDKWENFLQTVANNRPP